MQKAVWLTVRREIFCLLMVVVRRFQALQSTGKRTAIRHRFDKLACIDGEWWGVDIKKTVSVSERDFSMSIWKYRYHARCDLQ